MEKTGLKAPLLDLWVGLFVVVGAAALFFLALKVGSSNVITSADTYTVTARFDNIGGLKPRAPVKSAGVVVGRVESIRFDNETFEAVAELRLDQRYRFPLDTGASILTSGLLGEQYVGLDAGGDPVALKDGDRVKLTQSAVVLENLISQFLYNQAQEAPAAAPGLPPPPGAATP